MSTTRNRNLVLLLSSGHTVRIALKPDDLTGGVDEPNRGVRAVRQLLVNMPAVQVIPALDGEVVMAYVEDPSLPALSIGELAEPNDLQRITTEGPGCYHDGN